MEAVVRLSYEQKRDTWSDGSPKASIICVEIALQVDRSEQEKRTSLSYVRVLCYKVNDTHAL